MDETYREYEELYDRRDDLKDMIAALKKILTLGTVLSAQEVRCDYEQRLEAAKRDLDKTVAELSELSDMMREEEESENA